MGDKKARADGITLCAVSDQIEVMEKLFFRLNSLRYNVVAHQMMADDAVDSMRDDRVVMPGRRSEGRRCAHGRGRRNGWRRRRRRGEGGAYRVGRQRLHAPGQRAKPEREAKEGWQVASHGWPRSIR